MSDFSAVDGSIFYLTDRPVSAAIEATSKTYKHPLCFESDELLELVSLRKPLLIIRCKNLGLSIEGEKEDF